ncbi:MAG: elongation factor 1-beta [Theionarchaea archaeon]|nr:elongation factor 1-beta [Theionarchaea archaeon]
MFNLIATLRVLPESPEVNLEALEQSIKELIPSNMELHKIEQEPIAFGLVALNVIVLTTDDEKGDVTPLEESIQNLDLVSQVEVTDVRRTLG